jgi:hypothetical protein
MKEKGDYGILNRAVSIISNRSNMSNDEAENLTPILSIYLEEGKEIIRKWRKSVGEVEIVQGLHDSALLEFVINKYTLMGRNIYDSYTSGGVKSTVSKSPESILKSSCKQVM